MTRGTTFAIVEMEQGSRLTSQVIDVDPVQMKIGMQVEAAFRNSVRKGSPGPSTTGTSSDPRD